MNEFQKQDGFLDEKDNYDGDREDMDEDAQSELKYSVRDRRYKILSPHCGIHSI